MKLIQTHAVAGRFVYDGCLLSLPYCNSDSFILPPHSCWIWARLIRGLSVHVIMISVWTFAVLLHSIQVVLELDFLLQSAGVGAGDRQNYFSLVGFGRGSVDGITGIILSELAPQSVFLDALNQLQSSGVAEDGYAALEFAIMSTETRPDTVKQLILVTDEDRHVIRTDLNRDIIERAIVESGYVLNVVVNQGFIADPTDDRTHAMGLDSNGTAYVFNPSSPSLYTSSPGGVVAFTPFSFFPNTFDDYVDLAFGVGGAAWDLNFVVEGEPLSLALARAFAEVKIAEVMSVLRVCERCLCGESGAKCLETNLVMIKNCIGPAPGIVNDFYLLT